MKTKKEIEERIKKIKKQRARITSSGSRNKYNFAIGELLWIIT